MGQSVHGHTFDNSSQVFQCSNPGLGWPFRGLPAHTVCFFIKASWRRFTKTLSFYSAQEKVYNITNNLSSNNNKNQENHGELQPHHGSGLCPRKSLRDRPICI